MPHMSTIELWGGLECTINRVGDRFCDQLARCGHYARLDDLDALAALGIRTLRYPALWEGIAPHGVADADWRWCDAALARLRDLGIDPIIGLVHHGSGPRETHLLDPGFAAGLAAYAAAFAERYPWVRRYTPVNEPLTTARFAGLYGHWYPHRRDERAFVAALLNQCCGIADAMRAIRARVPDAQLIQTEDAGSIRAGHRLAAQAAFENQRRWLSLDLLTGTVDEHHPLWRYLMALGADRSQLARLQDEPVAPSVIGLNYYVTSDRFLDDRLDRYPPSAHGGNGRQRYADVEAVRVEGIGLRGHAAVLTETWHRYQRPVAITEAHLGCTREEQMRWLAEAWHGAHAAAAQGVDVRAVAVWALLGSWDWDSLLTRGDNHYELGAFDVRTGALQPTAVAGLIRDLAAGGEAAHPVLDGSGWWRPTGAVHSSARPILITGANGTLGRAFVRACEARGLRYIALTRADLDIADPEAVRGAVDRWRPWAIVNAAGYVRVDEAEREAVACRRANAVGPAVLAAVCRKANIQLVTFSSDLVFDGLSARPYVESDHVCPLNNYGRSKVEAERRVLAFAPSALVIRTSAFFGPWDNANVISCALDALASGRTFRATSRAIVSPTYVPDLVDRALDLLIDGAAGLWHLANAGAVSWLEFARMAAVAARLDPEAISDCHAAELQRPATRPPYSVLGSERGGALPSLDESLLRFVRDRTVVGTAA
jgi:dTDP-4-dehydrorhamnose reductase